jgi:hypothetical protein
MIEHTRLTGAFRCSNSDSTMMGGRSHDTLRMHRIGKQVTFKFQTVAWTRQSEDLSMASDG